MATTNSDKAWKAYGKKDPYFGVLTHEKFRDENLNEDHKKEFFETGHKYANRIFKTVQKQFDLDFNPESVLDFGCGTGRLALGFAPLAKRVVGIDISENMLNEAKANAQAMGHAHLEFYMSDDTLSAVANQQFDLVNCYIVLQHINVERGYQIIQELVDRVKPGGIGVMQINYTCQKGRLGKWVDFFRYRIPMVHGGLNLLQSKPFSEPLMQMNEYDLNKVFFQLQKSGVVDAHIQYEAHGDCWGVTVFFQKN